MTRSECFLYICAAFIAGVLAGSYYDFEIWILLFLTGTIAMLFFIDIKGRYARVFLVLMFFVIGFARTESAFYEYENGIKYDKIQNGEKAAIEAKIVHVKRTKTGNQEVLLSDLRERESGRAISGKLIAYFAMYPEINECGALRVEGKINIPENFDGFDYRMYLASRGVNYLMYYPEAEVVGDCSDILTEFSAGIRNYAYELNKKIYPEPQSGIMNALILGIESDISEEVIDAFNRTGTRHLLAISGFNISIIAVILMQLLLSLGLKRSRAFYCASVGIILYILIIESSSSSIRAGIMGELTLIAFKLGRLPSATNAIVFAAGLMLLENPFLLRYDIGFQLSFLAVMGLIYIYPRFEPLLANIKDIFGLKSIFMATLSALIATFPVLLVNFGNVSLLSVLSNMLILPFSVAVMIGGFIIVFLGTISLYLARVLSWPIWLMIEYQVRTIEYISRFDVLSVKYDGTNGIIALAYYFILLVVLFGKTLILRMMQRAENIKKIPNS